MKWLRFHEILLLSHKERSAQRIKFHESVTVIKGANDSGKSCLLKSLYQALGATPRQLHPTWEGLNVILLLRFSIDGVIYHSLRYQKQYSIFDSEGSCLGVFSRITSELGPFLGELLDFHLQLTNRSTKLPEQATPAFIFLPFYFDQDRSWADSWESFDNLQQFSGYRRAIADFHSGCRPNEFYLAKSRREEARVRLEELRNERGVLEKVQAKLRQVTSDVQFDIDLESYQREVSELLCECNQVKQREDHLRNEIVDLSNQKAVIERQMLIAQSAAAELERDFEFASSELADHVECPTCGAGYENSFIERFGIAEDEDRIRALFLELRSQLEICESGIERARSELSAVGKHRQRVDELLQSKRGDVTLQDVIRSEGRKDVKDVLNKEIHEANQRVGGVDAEIVKAEEEMKKFSDSRRTKEIKGFYRKNMQMNLIRLGVPSLPESAYKEFSGKIRESGSDQPRALLAFYFAMLKTIERYSTATFCPVVMDSPKQQDQDDLNWEAMLEFIRDEAPEGGQVIIGLVDELGLDLKGEVVHLKEERSLLVEDKFEEVSEVVRPFLDAMVAYS